MPAFFVPILFPGEHIFIGIPFENFRILHIDKSFRLFILRLYYLIVDAYTNIGIMNQKTKKVEGAFVINLKDYGYIEHVAPKDGLIPGRVTEHMRDRYTVVTEYGEVSANLKGSFVHNIGLKQEMPHVGDFVFLKHNLAGISQITEVLPRRSKFSRANFLGHAVGYVKHAYEQVVAANFDYVFIL